MTLRTGGRGEIDVKKNEKRAKCGCTMLLQDNVPDRPYLKVAPVGSQLVTMALKIKTVAIPKRWMARQKWSPCRGL